MTLDWTSSLDGVDWQELADLFHAAPLGGRTAGGLATAFGNSRYRWLVRDGGRLVAAGRALADGVDCSYICDVAVLPAYQRSGIGKELVSRLVEESKGHKKIILYSVRGMESFYEKLGFRPLLTAMAIFQDRDGAIANGHIKEP